MCCIQVFIRSLLITAFITFLSVQKYYCLHHFENQAFIQNGKDIKMLGIDGVEDITVDKIPQWLTDDGKVPASPVRFDPPFLDFKENHVGQPHLEQVTLINPDLKQTVHLLSISASTPHFHCSFFQDKAMAAGENTTFDVVFLAREVGNVENTLFIRTSRGTYKYQVFGIGTPSPYRLHSFIGAHIPVNSSFSPYVHIYNPHSFVLQITEMYTSGGDLHLELPNGAKTASKKLWEIPPYETRTVMRLRMLGRQASNHTSFVKIKTNSKDLKHDLVLPVEIQVSNKPGLYCPDDKLNFGILRTLDNPKTMKLLLINSGSLPMYVTNVELEKPNEAVSINFRPVKILPGVTHQTPVAMITFTAVKALRPNMWSGNIIVKTKDSDKKLVVPYSVDVLHGSLVYDANSTKFFTGENRNITRKILISNTFNFTVAVYRVTLLDTSNRYFRVLNFTRPVFIAPQATETPFSLHFTPNDADKMHFITQMGLFSNASLFVIPLFVYNGKLKVVPHRPELFQGQLNFGTLGVEESRSLTFTLRNENPVDVTVSSVELVAGKQRARVELLGVERGNATALSRLHNTSQLRDAKMLVLKPYHFAVYNVTVFAPDWQGEFKSKITVRTQFEVLNIPYIFRAAEGSLSAIPDKAILERSHPARITTRLLTVQSTFTEYMELNSVYFRPNDTRFYFQPSGNMFPVRLKPLETTTVGKIFFDPKRVCQEDCYAGFSTNTPTGQQWLLGLTLDKEVVDIDQYMRTRLQHHWLTLTGSDQHVVNVTVLMDTTHVRGFLFHAQAHLMEPSLVPGGGLGRAAFPLTQLGNYSEVEFVLENPADVPVLTQVLPLSQYPAPQALLDLLPARDTLQLKGLYLETEDTQLFQLDEKDSSSARLNVATVHRRQIEAVFGVRPHAASLTTLLQPRSKFRFRLRFMPEDVTPRHSLILVRNNLTVLETILVNGQGGRGQIHFQGVPPESSGPLLFELTEKHLKSCDRAKHLSGAQPSFTVQRPFLLKNVGQLVVFVHGFSFGAAAADSSTNLDMSSCHGFGFQVMNCVKMELAPNETRRVDIAFTPDFTMHRVQQMFFLHTSLGAPFNFTVQASLPPHMLSKCTGVLPRPEWELVLYYTLVATMSCVLLFILVSAYFEADRIFTMDVFSRQAVMNHVHNAQHPDRVLDLKRIAREPLDFFDSQLQSSDCSSAAELRLQVAVQRFAAVAAASNYLENDSSNSNQHNHSHEPLNTQKLGGGLHSNTTATTNSCSTTSIANLSTVGSTSATNSISKEVQVVHWPSTRYKRSCFLRLFMAILAGLRSLLRLHNPHASALKPKLEPLSVANSGTTVQSSCATASDSSCVGRSLLCGSLGGGTDATKDRQQQRIRVPCNSTGITAGVNTVNVQPNPNELRRRGKGRGSGSGPRTSGILQPTQQRARPCGNDRTEMINNEPSTPICTLEFDPIVIPLERKGKARGRGKAANNATVNSAYNSSSSSVIMSTRVAAGLKTFTSGNASDNLRDMEDSFSNSTDSSGCCYDEKSSALDTNVDLTKEMHNSIRSNIVMADSAGDCTTSYGSRHIRAVLPNRSVNFVERSLEQVAFEGVDEDDAVLLNRTMDSGISAFPLARDSVKQTSELFFASKNETNEQNVFLMTPHEIVQDVVTKVHQKMETFKAPKTSIVHPVVQHRPQNDLDTLAQQTACFERNQQSNLPTTTHFINANFNSVTSSKTSTMTTPNSNSYRPSQSVRPERNDFLLHFPQAQTFNPSATSFYPRGVTPPTSSSSLPTATAFVTPQPQAVPIAYNDFSVPHCGVYNNNNNMITSTAALNTGTYPAHPGANSQSASSVAAFTQGELQRMTLERKRSMLEYEQRQLDAQLCHLQSVSRTWGSLGNGPWGPLDEDSFRDSSDSRWASLWGESQSNRGLWGGVQEEQEPAGASNDPVAMHFLGNVLASATESSQLSRQENSLGLNSSSVNWGMMSSSSNVSNCDTGLLDMDKKHITGGSSNNNTF